MYTNITKTLITHPNYLSFTMDFNELAYGTGSHRRAPRHAAAQEHPESMGQEVMELGKMAVGGMVTVGVIGALGSAFQK